MGIAYMLTEKGSSNRVIMGVCLTNTLAWHALHSAISNRCSLLNAITPAINLCIHVHYFDNAWDKQNKFNVHIFNVYSVHIICKQSFASISMLCLLKH